MSAKTRSWTGEQNPNSSGLVNLHYTRGYERIYHNYDGDRDRVYVHQLVLIANGADPSKVLPDNDYHTHHKNEIRWDNRPSNLELVTETDHSELHDRAGYLDPHKQKYTIDELIDWIIAYYIEFGQMPQTYTIRHWPGPTPKTYLDRFGSIKRAKNMAKNKVEHQ